jgi:hypothetical protein
MVEKAKTWSDVLDDEIIAHNFGDEEFMKLRILQLKAKAESLTEILKNPEIRDGYWVDWSQRPDFTETDVQLYIRKKEQCSPNGVPFIIIKMRFRNITKEYLNEMAQKVMIYKITPEMWGAYK